jgi:hypothetical protein
MYDKNKDSLVRIKYNYREQNRCKVETLLKVQLHLNTYWKNLLNGMDEYQHDANYQNTEQINASLFARMERKEDEVAKRLAMRVGFVENSLRLINDNSIEELLEYSVRILLSSATRR